MKWMSRAVRGDATKVMCFSAHHIKGHLMRICITGDINLDRSAKVNSMLFTTFFIGEEREAS